MLTSLRHERPADVDVVAVLRVVRRGLHLPVSRVQSQRGEVVGESLIITEHRAHKQRVNFHCLMCLRSVQTSELF